MPTKPTTKATVTATALLRFRPRRSKKSTAGFSPIAKKSEIIIRTKIWLADAKARSSVMAITAPDAARNPK